MKANKMGEGRASPLPSPKNAYKQRASGGMVKGEGKFDKTFREENRAVSHKDPW